MKAIGSGQRTAGRVQAISLLMPATLAVMAIALLAPILPGLQARFGSAEGGVWLVPLIITLPALCMVLFAPLAGWLGDRFGRRRLLLTALFFYAIFGMSPILLDDLVTILVSRVLVGMSEAVVLVLSTALISDYFEGEVRDRWLGYQTAVSSISAVFLFGLGGALGSFGWRGPFALYGSSLVMLVIVWAVTWEPPKRQEEREGTHVMLPFPWRHMVPICAISLAASMLFYVVQLQSASAFVAIGISAPATIGLLAALATTGTPIGTVIFRFQSMRPPAMLLCGAFAAVCIGLLGMSVVRDYRMLVAAEFIAQLGCGIMIPTLLTWSARGLAFAQRGRGIGLWQGIFSFGGVVSPPMVVALTIVSGGVNATLAVLAAVSAVAAVTALLFAILRFRAGESSVLTPVGPIAGH